MKILVTGGAGFIGSALIRYILNSSSDSVVNLDKLTYASNLCSLKSVSQNRRYSFEQVDICDKNDLFRIFQQYNPDAVMHLAAESHVDNSISSPGAFIETNVIGTFNLLEAARGYWSNLEGTQKDNFRFHHISTDEVYGDLASNSPAFTEKNPYEPSSPYSASKASSDHLVRAWLRTYDFPTVITNCSNNYGPYQFHEKLVPLIINNALKGEPLPIYGKGDQIRDWLYVDDHVKALVQVLKNGRLGETYNIGGKNEKTNLEVVSTICAMLDNLNPKKTGSYLEQVVHVEDRPGHDKRYAINASKITRELGWEPEENFESGIKKTVEWYLGAYLKDHA